MGAHRRLLDLCTYGKGHITMWARTVEPMTNGLEYYFVEVACCDGIVYGIEAYGEEAIALHNETMELLKKGLGDNLTRDIL